MKTNPGGDSLPTAPISQFPLSHYSLNDVVSSQLRASWCWSSQHPMERTLLQAPHVSSTQIIVMPTGPSASCAFTSSQEVIGSSLTLKGEKMNYIQEVGSSVASLQQSALTSRAQGSLEPSFTFLIR